MDTGWRAPQIDHNRRVRMVIVEGGKSSGTRFWGWEAVLMFYEIVIALDGYAEMRGIPVPKSHKARRAIVERHLPHLIVPYDGLYGLSLVARYHCGYAIGEGEGRKAARCHEALVRSIPVQ